MASKFQGGAYSGTSDQSSGVFRKEIASYSSATPFFRAILDACISGARPRIPSLRFLDAMSGPGKLGRDLLPALEGLQSPGSVQVAFNDTRPEPLERLRSDGFATVQCDIRDLHRTRMVFDVIAVRYGLKDLPEGGAQQALSSIYQSLGPGGVLVIADMTAKSPQGQAGAIEVHAAKQRLAGRDERTEGRCFIPTDSQWLSLVREAGFGFTVLSSSFISEVETSQWMGQFAKSADPLQQDAHDSDCIRQMNELILATAHKNPAFSQEFCVRAEGEKVFVNFPIMVLSAVKPE